MPKKSAQLSIAEQTPATGGVAAVDKALSMLASFQQGETALTLTDFADRTQMHKARACAYLRRYSTHTLFSGLMTATMRLVVKSHACKAFI